MSWRSWQAFWARREPPHALAMVRVCLGLVVLYDLLVMGWYGLVPVFYGPTDAGGIATALDRPAPPILYTLLADTPSGGAWVLWGIMVACAVAFTAGFATPVAAVVLVWVWAQWAMGSPTTNRAVDRLCRNALMILAFSGCGRAWSIDAWLRTGTWRGALEIGAWARYLLIAQIVVMYVTAGLYKTGFLWTPMGGYAALYVLLQDPSMQRFDFAWLAHQPWYFLSQIGAAVTVYWQWSYALVPLFLYWRATPDRPGRLRAWSNRLHLDLVWIAIGVSFHLGLFLTCELGIFPWAMLALYPVFLGGDRVRLNPS